MKHIITLSLLAVAVSMTASISSDEKPCCKKSQPCCKEKPACCDTAKADTLPLCMEQNGNPQL